MTITVSNAMGTATATYTIAVGDTIALTPPMGWNSYDSYGSSVTEQEFLDGAAAVKSTLAPYGWNTVVIDYLWFGNDDKIDGNGRWIPALSRWPSAANGVGFRSVADKVHAMGLSFGIHIMRGIPRVAYTANSPIAGSTYKAQEAGDMTDTCPWENHNYGVRGDTPAGQAWYDSIFAQYASWGIDFVKVDDMIFHSGVYTNANYSTNVYHAAETAAIRAAIDKSGRSIVLSLSPGPMQTKDSAILGMHANMWRTVDDFWDTKGISNLADVFTAAGELADAERALPGALAGLRHVAAWLHRTPLSGGGGATHERLQPRRADVGDVPVGYFAVAPHARREPDASQRRHLDDGATHQSRGPGGEPGRERHPRQTPVHVREHAGMGPRLERRSQGGGALQPRQLNGNGIHDLLRAWCYRTAGGA